MCRVCQCGCGVMGAACAHVAYSQCCILNGEGASQLRRLPPPAPLAIPPNTKFPTVCERKAHIMFNISDHPPRPAVTTPAGRQLLAPVAAVLELSPAEKALYLRRGPAGRAGRVRRWDWACCVVVVGGGWCVVWCVWVGMGGVWV